GSESLNRSPSGAYPACRAGFASRGTAVARDEGGTPSAPRPKKSWVALLEANADQDQSVRRRGGAGPRPIARREKLGEGRRRSLAAPHLDQRADDVPHHVLQERGRLDPVDEQPTIHPQAALDDPAHRRPDGLGIRGPEGGEVVLSLQRARRLVHGGDIDRRRQVPG